MNDKVIEQILEKVGVYNGSDMGGKTYIVRPQELEAEILKYYQPKTEKTDKQVFDKEKQIEELAKVLQDRIINKTWRAEKVAKELYGIAVPEDSVVLSREELEKLQTDMRRLAYQNCNLTIENKNIKENLDIEVLRGKEMAEKYQARIDELEEELDMLIKEQKEDRSYEIKQASKETAEKILNEMQEFFRPFDKKSPIFLDLLLTKLETVVKKFGVEIKE